jgi:hypothetical protein
MKTLLIAVATLLLAAQSGKAPNPQELDKLLAPVALYPDALLAQMLLCTSNPGKVGTLNEWLASNSNQKGTELQDAATKAGFEPSFAALVLFPQVVEYMAGNLDWTTKLGQAFAADKNAVFGSIQRLRGQATKAGNLKDTPQQDVQTKTTSNGEQVIVIEPANPQVVYVPQYNPQVVYTQPSTTTVVVQEDDDDEEAAAAGLIGFTAGIAIGAAMDNDYYYGPYGFYGGGYMYNDAWDDYYDAREDAIEDRQDNREDRYEDRSERREDISEERGERAGNAQEQRTERQQQRQQNPETQARRSEAQAKAQQGRSSGATASSTSTRSSATTTSQASRGYGGSQAATQRSSGSDAFSGYSSGTSTRASSSRGSRSRGGGGRGGRGGGGRRR